MNIDQLIRMANQIGTFFEAMPDRQEALAGIAKHLKDFWDPRMRRELLAYFDATLSADPNDGPESPPAHELSLIVTEAIHQHRTTINPAAVNLTVVDSRLIPPPKA
jgi:formate dehydrogenase subunit delta